MRILVTGGNSGIGAATALKLAKEGHEVTIVGRDESKAEKVLGLSQRRIEFIRADLSTLSGTRTMCDTFAAKHDSVDILILGAGVFKLDPASRTEDDLHVMLATNFMHRFLVSRLLEPLLKKSRDPRIVLLTASMSTNIRIDEERFPAYKPFRGLRDLPNVLIANFHAAQHLAETLPNVSVGVVAAGVVITDILRDYHWALTSALKLIAPLIAISPETAAVNLCFAAVERAPWAGSGALYWPKPGLFEYMEPISLLPSATTRIVRESERVCGLSWS